jgi:hypothetical protein
MSQSEETCLPAPEQLVIVPLNEMELAEQIERHIEYVNGVGRAVHLHSSFVRHYLKRSDQALPVATSIAQLPIVLYNGTILTERGLNRYYGIIFRVPVELKALLPTRDNCSDAAIARAMRFLTNEWPCDVATDYQGKCIIIACALTILERALLPQRPAFFITAGQRGGGKTTTIHMVSMASLGLPAAAAAWSPSEEERRKALFAYLGSGLPLLVWDNVPRGTVISCPSIEKALTTEHYSDRILGETEIKIVPAYTIQVFTGNNIAPRGDLVARSLIARLAIDRPDPENREFRRPNPVAWTDVHRGRILRAFYTILLGNPRRGKMRDELSPAPTRFKEWWDMVGSAVEHAAEQHTRLVENEVRCLIGEPHPTAPPSKIQFKKLFLGTEQDDEQASSLAIVLEVLHQRWPKSFQASDVAHYAGKAEPDAIAFRDALEHAAGKPLKTISATTVTWRLKALVGAPVVVRKQIFVLKYEPDHGGGNFVIELPGQMGNL